jgi:hypothetical protein
MCVSAGPTTDPASGCESASTDCNLQDFGNTSVGNSRRQSVDDDREISSTEGRRSSTGPSADPSPRTSADSPNHSDLSGTARPDYRIKPKNACSLRPI